MQQALRDRVYGALTATAGVVLLIGGLAVVDRRVRRQLVLVFSTSGPTVELNALSGRLGELLVIILQAVRDHTIEHAPLVIFSLAAAVLVLFMLRT